MLFNKIIKCFQNRSGPTFWTGLIVTRPPVPLGSNNKAGRRSLSSLLAMEASPASPSALNPTLLPCSEGKISFEPNTEAIK